MSKNQKGQLLDFHTWRAGIWYRILRGTGIRERKPYSTVTRSYRRA